MIKEIEAAIEEVYGSNNSLHIFLPIQSSSFISKNAIESLYLHVTHLQVL